MQGVLLCKSCYAKDYGYMGKRGPKPKRQAKTRWDAELAYAIGLITADGCLFKDGRHVELTSKDLEQAQTFKDCLGIGAKIGTKYSGAKNMAYRVEFSDVHFYSFLQEIGLMPAKSKALGALAIPDKYFIDFVRGYFDGDGCSYSFYDSVYKNSYRFYIFFTSASPAYIEWLRNQLKEYLGISGHITSPKGKSYQNLKYAKREAIVLARALYYEENLPSLTRKRRKIESALMIADSQYECA